MLLLDPHVILELHVSPHVDASLGAREVDEGVRVQVWDDRVVPGAIEDVVAQRPVLEVSDVKFSPHL